MREIGLSGYIDEGMWFGDEITPESLHESLYGLPDSPFTDDVHIRLNSYGGSCNAATRMYDDIHAYPGNVRITVSGTAASAATVLSMAADRLEMTPGSLWMIHDPSTIAWGNERDLSGAVDLLRACKESILNVYGRRCKKKREDIAAMMAATTWMDAQAALDNGFIDGIAGDVKAAGAENAQKHHTVNRKEAEKRVQAWLDRRKPQLSHAEPGEVPLLEGTPSPGDEHPSSVQPAGEQAEEPEGQDGTAQALPVGTGSSPPEAAQAAQTPEKPGTTEQPEKSGTPIAQLQKRLGLIMPTRR